MRRMLVGALALAAVSALLIADTASARVFVAGGVRGVGFRGGVGGVRRGVGWVRPGVGYGRWGWRGYGAGVAAGALVGAAAAYGVGYPYGYDYNVGYYGYAYPGYSTCYQTVALVPTIYGYQQGLVTNCY